MRVLTTTAHRVADATQDHGFLVEIDWAAKEVLRFIEAPPLYSRLGQRNRGGRRGLRGITRYAGLVWFASCDALFGLLPDTLELDRIITHPWMAHIHEIEAGQDGIWVTSTGGNGIFLVGLDQQARRASWLCGEPDVDLRIHLEKARDAYHLNTVFENNGEVFAYALTTGQVFRMLPGPAAEVAALEKKCHNVVPTEFGWFRNDSVNSRVLLGDRTLDLPRLGLASEYTKPGWLRGMARFPNGNFLVGSSPASLYEIDPHKLEIVDQMALSDDVRWTIHGIFIDAEQPIARPLAEELADAQRRFRQVTGYSKGARMFRTSLPGRALSRARRILGRALDRLMV
jgi:hypothetical protein